MPLPLIPLLVSAGVSAGKAIHGAVQKRKARKALESMERPQYEQSSMLKENLAQARRDAQRGLPEQVMQRQAQNIDRQGAMAAQNIRSLQGGLAGVGGAVQAQADSFSRLISQDAAAREANKQQLMAARSAMAGEEEKAFQRNVMNPFDEQRAALGQNMAVGQQNLSGGIDQLGATAMQAAAMSGNGNGMDRQTMKANRQWDQSSPEYQQWYAQQGANALALMNRPQ